MMHRTVAGTSDEIKTDVSERLGKDIGMDRQTAKSLIDFASQRIEALAEDESIDPRAMMKDIAEAAERRALFKRPLDTQRLDAYVATLKGPHLAIYHLIEDGKSPSEVAQLMGMGLKEAQAIMVRIYAGLRTAVMA